MRPSSFHILRTASVLVVCALLVLLLWGAGDDHSSVRSGAAKFQPAFHSSVLLSRAAAGPPVPMGLYAGRKCSHKLADLSSLPDTGEKTAELPYGFLRSVKSAVAANPHAKEALRWMAAGYSWQEANRNSSTVKAWLTSGTVDERREKHEIWVRVLLAINYEQQATCRTDPGLQALVEKRFNDPMQRSISKSGIRNPVLPLPVSDDPFWRFTFINTPFNPDDPPPDIFYGVISKEDFPPGAFLLTPQQAAISIPQDVIDYAWDDSRVQFMSSCSFHFLDKELLNTPIAAHLMGLREYLPSALAQLRAN
jgi:hypothetical protein